jgi:preprotein translocase subunit SecG
MTTTLLLGLLILDSFVLVAAILLQSGKGQGMAASFGGVSSSPDAFIGTRQAGNLLTKVSWWAGGIFLTIAFVLQIASARSVTPKSVLDRALTPPPAPRSLPTPSPASAAPALPFQSAPATATPAPAQAATPGQPATRGAGQAGGKAAPAPASAPAPTPKGSAPQ